MACPYSLSTDKNLYGFESFRKITYSFTNLGLPKIESLIVWDLKTLVIKTKKNSILLIIILFN